MAARDPLVVFTPSGKRGNFPVGTPLLQAARSLGVDIDSVCGGRGLCGRCQVLVAEGEFAKHGVSSSSASLSPFSEPEKRYSRRAPLAEGRRLSCSARVEADVVIDVPATSQVHRQVVRKEADAHAIELDPVVRLHYVQVKQPDMHDPSGDLRRLFEALESEWGLKDLTCDLSVLQTLQPTLRAGAWQVPVAVPAAKQIIAVWPGLHELAYGLAIDVGSTTIAAHLCDLGSGEVVASAGVMNPQIRFGEDLMSRVSYSMMNPGGAALMTAAVREALGGLAADVARDAGISHEDILEATLVGNPIMHHLLIGIDPVELGGAPFALAVDHSLTFRANVIDLKLNRNARVYVLRCIAGHVGADAAGMVLAERPDLDAEMTLLLDVRAIQLAKAALYAGVALLMERLGIDHVDRIRLAGAFGSHIDVKYATILGMIPDCDLSQVRSAGNAAGTGARIALLDSTSRGVIETLVRRIEKVETAIEPRFQHHFVEAMAIPHKTAGYANLRRVVDLPAPKESTSQSETRGRRPRRTDPLKTD